MAYFFEDTTGRAFGPTHFLDIYERPPFLRVESSLMHGQQTSWMDLTIFELGSDGPCQRRISRPAAVISFHGPGLRGSVRLHTGTVVQLERWLKKSARFGSTLTRQFKATDGICYQWSFRRPGEHEWTCVQLGTDRLVAHYDLKAVGERPSRTSGNVLTIYENWIHLAVEILASLEIMRHLHADVSQETYID